MVHQKVALPLRKEKWGEKKLESKTKKKELESKTKKKELESRTPSLIQIQKKGKFWI